MKDTEQTVNNLIDQTIEAATKTATARDALTDAANKIEQAAQQFGDTAVPAGSVDMKEYTIKEWRGMVRQIRAAVELIK